MAAKETVSKIMKGIGNSKLGQSAKKAGKYIDGKLLEDIPDSHKYNAMLYQVLPKRIKQKYVYGTMAGVVGYNAIKGINNASERANLGVVEGGSLSHMTSDISPLTQSLQNGEYGSENIMHKTSAQGDIVFALHNMR